MAASSYAALGGQQWRREGLDGMETDVEVDVVD